MRSHAAFDKVTAAAARVAPATIAKPRKPRKPSFHAYTVSQLLANYRDPRAILLELASMDTFELARLLALHGKPSGQIDDHKCDPERIKAVALRELREETGYVLTPNGELISLGYYFASPGFTDERGYFFLARPVQPCVEGQDFDEGESILDCREFTSEEIRRMIADNEIRDANTLGICATLAARGLLSLAPR